MSATSSIEWTDKTWNPVRGCSVVSPGCVNCYAMKQAHRFSAPGKPYDGLTKLTKAGPQWTGRIRTVDEALVEPLSWRKPQRVFVNSMSDLFHEEVPFEFVDRVFAVMASASQHTFQVLTKRADRMRAYMQRVSDGAPAAGERYERELREHFERYRNKFKEGYSLPEPPTPELRFIYDSAALQESRPTNPCDTTLRSGFSGGEFHWRQWPLTNVWIGVSAEDQKRADERIPQLLQTPAAVRFISAEPLLESVVLNAKWLHKPPCYCCPGGIHRALDWVIVGGESGPGARPFEVAWAWSIVQQCKSAGVPVFMKQMGAHVLAAANVLGEGWPPTTAFATHDRRVFLNDKKGGNPDEWPEDLRVRQFPEVRA